MSKRNYKELWNQLKVVVLCSGKVRWHNKAIYDTMYLLELHQLNQDPVLKVMMQVDKVVKK